MKKYSVLVLKSMLFCYGIFFVGDSLPDLLFYADPLFDLSPGGILIKLILLILLALAYSLFRSRFFGPPRQMLTVFWMPAVLLWLIPFTGVAFTFSLRGGAGEWREYVKDTIPLLRIMLASILAMRAMAFIVGPGTKRMLFLRVALFLIFTALCVPAAYMALDFFYCSWSTFKPDEIIKELLLPYIGLLALWIGIASIPIGAILKEWFPVSAKTPRV